MLDVRSWARSVAGLLSFVSPCVLPIVPPYLAWLAGDELRGTDRRRGRGAGTARRVVLSAVAFVLGFTTVFVALGATASVIGQTIAQYFDVLSIIAGAIIIVMGLHFLGVFRIGLLYRRGARPGRAKAGGADRRLCDGARLRLRLDALRRPGAGGDPVRRRQPGHGGARRACCLPSYSLGIGVPFILAAVFASPLPRLGGALPHATCAGSRWRWAACWC